MGISNQKQAVFAFEPYCPQLAKLYALGRPVESARSVPRNDGKSLDKLL
jgi:hypothetical protein